jgi:hypothetical protein
MQQIERDEVGRPSAVIDANGHRQVVLRDDNGRVVGLEGRSRVDDLADALGALADVVEGVDVDVEAVASRVAAVEVALKDGLTRQLDEVPAAATIEQLRSELAHAVQATTGRTLFDRTLLVHVGAIRAAAVALGIRHEVTIRLATELDCVRRKCDGFYEARGRKGHYVFVRPGLTAQRACHVIAHELVHAAQVERLGRDFEARYRDPKGKHRLESQAEEESGHLVTLLARAGHPLVR